MRLIITALIAGLIGFGAGYLVVEKPWQKNEASLAGVQTWALRQWWAKEKPSSVKCNDDAPPHTYYCDYDTHAPGWPARYTATVKVNGDRIWVASTEGE